MRRCFHEQEWSWFDDPGENHQDFVALASYVGPIILVLRFRGLIMIYTWISFNLRCSDQIFCPQILTNFNGLVNIILYRTRIICAYLNTCSERELLGVTCVFSTLIIIYFSVLLGTIRQASVLHCILRGVGPSMEHLLLAGISFTNSHGNLSIVRTSPNP